MPSFRLHRKPLDDEAGEEPETLEKLRRRWTAGAIGSACGYLAVMILTTVRGSTLNEPVTYGLLVAFGTVAALSALAAILVWTVMRIPQSQPSPESQAETVEWAIRLGEDMADAFRTVSPGDSEGAGWEKTGRRSPTGIVHQRRSESPKLR